MDYRESAIKLVVNIVLIFFFYLLGVPLSLSFVTAHTLNMLLNGHYYAMRRHMGLGKNDPEKFIAYIEKLHKRIQNKPYLLATAAYGSLSKNIYRPTSDIDIRLIPRCSQLSFIKACIFALTERVRAFIMHFPLDLYVFDLADIDNKIKPKEPPIIFYDPEQIISQKYAEIIMAIDFIKRFRSTYV